MADRWWQQDGEIGRLAGCRWGIGTPRPDQDRCEEAAAGGTHGRHPVDVWRGQGPTETPVAHRPGMVVLQLTCFTWSLANLTLTLPFLARRQDTIQDSFQFGRSLGRERGRQVRTVEEVSAVL